MCGCVVVDMKGQLKTCALRLWHELTVVHSSNKANSRKTLQSRFGIKEAMPRPRFQKLSIEKQQAILEAAAREFSAHGYEGASINKILETAQLSKGAAYYYFDDKADLFWGFWRMAQ